MSAGANQGHEPPCRCECSSLWGVSGACCVLASGGGREAPRHSADWITKNHVSRGLTNEKSTVNPDILPLHRCVQCAPCPPPPGVPIWDLIPTCPGGCGVRPGGGRRLPTPRAGSRSLWGPHRPALQQLDVILWDQPPLAIQSPL